MAGPRRVAEGLIALVAIPTALYFSSGIFAPVALAIFVIALIWPIQERLQALMPRLLALVVTMLLTLSLFSIFGYVAAWGFGRVGGALIAEATRFQAIYDQALLWLDSHGIAVSGIWMEHLNVGWLLRTVQGITGRLNTTLSFWVVVFVYVLLGLLEVDVTARKIRALDSPAARAVLLQGSVATAAKFRRYMVVRTQMSVLTGALVWAIAALSGLSLALEWGVLAFTLNYIPFLGPLIATLFPTLFSLAQFQSWEVSLAYFVAFNLVQFVVGSYIEPRVSGNAVSISPFIILFSVFFWAFLWGIFGAFIGVPITIAILTFCAQHPSSRFVSDLLGSGELRRP
jgi:predicted PurR-regulated permease PerM